MSILDTIKKTVATGKDVQSKKKALVKEKRKSNMPTTQKKHLFGKRESAYHSNIIRYPYITEKSSLLQEKNNTYVFAVVLRANKSEIKKAVKQIFNVMPERVNIAKKPGKKVFLSGHRGRSTTVKKAMITLKKGEKIDIGSA